MMTNFDINKAYTGCTCKLNSMISACKATRTFLKKEKTKMETIAFDGICLLYRRKKSPRRIVSNFPVANKCYTLFALLYKHA